MKKLVALIVACAVAWGGVQLVSGGDEDVTVQRIVDGDTLDASVARETVRIRLLNIDTPELGHDGNPSECYAEEAKQRLEALVPPGAKIHLEYDVERTDKYGRTLAGVFRDDTFVNEQLASEGLARAILVEPNSRFFERIRAAEQAPRNAGSKIFAASADCFAADRELQADFDELDREDRTIRSLDLNDPGSVAAARKHLGTIDRVLRRVRTSTSSNDFFYTDDMARFLDDVERRAGAAATQVDDTEARARQAEAEREAARRAEAERETARRAEAEREAARQAEAEREAARRMQEAQDRERERLRSEQEQQVPVPAAPPAPSSDKYTGCRAYGGNYALNNVDKNGRRYAKIDCASKVQIG
ncbi:thermonuclease family protein [Corynebacterium fournieri]|uniref:thermonuclease family protein n=1 Tax=Corynebacterium fournieri TaxID=1852390 RepID=UPI0015C42A75|nr:thermonuclease family protein [Corynebacterium fournieri]